MSPKVSSRRGVLGLLRSRGGTPYRPSTPAAEQSSTPKPTMPSASVNLLESVQPAPKSTAGVRRLLFSR